MRKFLVVTGLCLVLASTAIAQDAPAAEIFGGYSYYRPDSEGGEGLNMHGWNASAAFSMSPALSLVGDVSGHYKSEEGVDFSFHHFLFGPRLSMRGGGAAPFVHALFGASRVSVGVDGLGSESDSAFGMALGGGVDAGSGPIGFRVVQVDYLLTRFGGATQSNFRLSTGILFRFGSR